MALERVEPRSYESELRERERELADMQSLAGFGSWEWDLSGPTAILSDEFCRILELPLGSTLNAGRFLDLVHPDDRESVVRQLDRARAGEKSSLRFRMIRADGEVRDVLGGCVGRRDGSGVVTHLFGTLQDVTKQRAAELAHAEARDLFETAFAQAPIGMALSSLDGRWLKVNAAACAITGWSESELLGRTFHEMTHPDDLASDLQHIERLLAGEITGYQLEKRYITRAGQEIWVLMSVSLARDAFGLPRHFISQMEDISARKFAQGRLQQAELEARTQRDHATAIISAMHEGYTLTVGGEIKAVNEAMCNLTGFSEQELIGTRMPLPFWPPELHSENLAISHQIVESLGGTFEVTLMRKTGERFVAEVTAEFAFDRTGESIGLVNTVRDVSVQREQQHELELLARTDSLTGLANRYVLQESLDREAALALRHDRSLALILLDLDWFKQVNDRHGHPVGDAVLVEVARRLSETVRSGEVLARVGGEEFAWLIPGATEAEAAIAADRARSAIATVPFATAGPLTMSAGVGFMHRPSDPDALYRLADRALYDAKQRGRNRTSCITDSVSLHELPKAV
jgi:diguanylate cyclase (GGDEF)-like protein/PAS domain S-box-containing protein